jgi:hypothetical protein
MPEVKKAPYPGETRVARVLAHQVGRETDHLVLAEFEEIRLRLQPPLAQGHYGLDRVNYLWSIQD